MLGFGELSYSTFDFPQIALMKQITQIKLRSKKICQICSISAICEKYNSNLDKDAYQKTRLSETGLFRIREALIR